MTPYTRVILLVALGDSAAAEEEAEAEANIRIPWQ